MPVAQLIAETLFLGEDLLPWLLLAFGAALVVANIAAFVRPPRAEPNLPQSERLDRPSLRRVAPMVLLGLVISTWAVATLVS